MTGDTIKLSMKGISQRILGAVYSSGTMTTAELSAKLADIPKPTLYRYVKMLIEAGTLEVVGTEKKRGGVERTLRLASSDEECGYEVFASAMLCVNEQFRCYFNGADPDPVRDMLAFSGATLMLDDGEYSSLLGEIGKLIEAAMNKEKRGSRKERQLYILSAPVMEEKQ